MKCYTQAVASNLLILSQRFVLPLQDNSAVISYEDYHHVFANIQVSGWVAQMRGKQHYVMLFFFKDCFWVRSS